MSFYIDTSVVVTGLLSEPDTAKVQSWFADREDENFIISSWSVTEFSSAVARRIRMGDVDPMMRSVLLAGLERLSEMWLVVPVDYGHFIEAARLIDRSTAPLRSGDALHLAVAKRRNAPLVTRDVGLHAVADTFRQPVILL